MMQKWNKLLSVLLFCTVIVPCGCQSLGAWMGSLDVSKDGTVSGELESAGTGGDFHKNTGLNLAAGDNSLVALTLAVAVAIGVPFAYPIQRALRRRRDERAVTEHRKMNGGAAKP